MKIKPATKITPWDLTKEVGFWVVVAVMSAMLVGMWTGQINVADHLAGKSVIEIEYNGRLANLA